jgi:hypothetical protein
LGVWRNRALAALAKAHDEPVGEKHGRGVHGDARDENVLCNIQSNEVAFVDFDWAGLEGAATYPYGLNHHDVRWPTPSRCQVADGSGRRRGHASGA